MKNLPIRSFKKLKPRQRAFSICYMDNDGHLLNTCRQMKMNPDSFYRWLKFNSLFKEYHEYIIALHTDCLEGLAYSALKDKLEKKDMKAVRTFYELKGKLKQSETKIDARNIQYTVKFKGAGLNDRLRAASEPGEDSPPSG